MKFNTTIKMKECITFSDRLFGFMFKRNFKHGLKFSNCNSIHTFFMLENIDVVMCDKNNNILYTFNNLKPCRIILPRKNVFITYELPIKK